MITVMTMLMVIVMTMINIISDAFQLKLSELGTSTAMLHV